MFAIDAKFDVLLYYLLILIHFYIPYWLT